MISLSVLTNLKNRFGSRFQRNVALAKLTTAHVGGPAEVVVTIESRDELADIVSYLWNEQIQFQILGSGSNLLYSDRGYAGVIILNRAKKIQIKTDENIPEIWAESGANMGMVARKAALAGISGLEWAATIPGTVGGAVYGNAGAYGSDIEDNLLLAEILQHESISNFWTCDAMQFGYRTSILKKTPGKAVILTAIFTGRIGDPQVINNQMNQFKEQRRNSQPPGASMGSMFKNPPGDYAGRLIEAAGLKGTTIGGVTVSPVHANFFVNNDQATAKDFWELIHFVQTKVYQQFQIKLELEVETIGFSTQTSNNYFAEWESSL